ncbi:hypothetical protein BX600DRAFT_510026 [Xylariales sp. PMI_506]|nr:hypothetical protein BX600DRAFT_510026 [Xylariales sp. PMI_506]
MKHMVKSPPGFVATVHNEGTPEADTSQDQLKHAPIDTNSSEKAPDNEDKADTDQANRSEEEKEPEFSKFAPAHIGAATSPGYGSMSAENSDQPAITATPDSNPAGSVHSSETTAVPSSAPSTAPPGEGSNGAGDRSEPIGIRARQTGPRSVDLHVHWADEQAASAATGPAPAVPMPAPIPPQPSSQPFVIPLGGARPSGPAAVSMNYCTPPPIHYQGAYPFHAVNSAPLVYSQPPPCAVHNQQSYLWVNPGLTPPVIQAPAIGTGSWCYPNYRQSPFFNGTAHYRTNPPWLINGAASGAAPVYMGHGPSYAVIWQ